MAKKRPQFVVAVRIVEAESYDGYGPCFAELAKFSALPENKNMTIVHMKAEHDAMGHRVKLFLLKDVIEPKPTKKNATAISMELAAL